MCAVGWEGEHLNIVCLHVLHIVGVKQVTFVQVKQTMCFTPGAIRFDSLKYFTNFSPYSAKSLEEM